jgi:hypothetical protein
MTARIANGCLPLRAATPSSSERPLAAMLRPSITLSLILYAPSHSLRRQSTLMQPVSENPEPRTNSLDTIAPSGTSRLPITPGNNPAGDRLRQTIATGCGHVTFEQSQEFLLLRRDHDPRETSENKAAEAGLEKVRAGCRRGGHREVL